MSVPPDREETTLRGRYFVYLPQPAWTCLAAEGESAIVRGKSVLLIIGGGIAAYKSLDVIRRLKERGAGVRAILTAAGGGFGAPLAGASLRGEKAFGAVVSLT